MFRTLIALVRGAWHGQQLNCIAVQIGVDAAAKVWADGAWDHVVEHFQLEGKDLTPLQHGEFVREFIEEFRIGGYLMLAWPPLVNKASDRLKQRLHLAILHGEL